MGDFSSKGQGAATGKASNWMKDIPAVVLGEVTEVKFKEVGANKTPQFLISVTDENGLKAEGQFWASEKAWKRTAQEFNRIGDKLLGSMSPIEAIDGSGEEYALALQNLLVGKKGYWLITAEVQYIPDKENAEEVTQWKKPVVFPFAAVYAVSEKEDADKSFAGITDKVKDDGVPDGKTLKEERSDNPTGDGTEVPDPSADW